MSIWDSVSPSSSSPDNSEITALRPDQIVIHDWGMEEKMQEDAKLLKSILEFSESLCIAIWEVADYIPDMRNSRNATFWKEKIIPNLKASLMQDVKARNLIVKSLGSIRDLAITIQKSGEIVKATRGSSEAIEIARKNIPTALAVLEGYIKIAETLENSAVEVFATQTEKIFEIIGPKAANFVQQKVDIELEIQRLEDQKQAIYDEITKLRAEMERLSHLIHATSARLNGTNEALQATRTRTDEMNEMNKRVDQAIQAIPETIPVTTHGRSSSFFGLFSRRWSHTEYVKNPDKDAQRNYYESVIAARAARIKEAQSEANQMQAVAQALNNDLSEYKRQYKEHQETLESKLPSIPEKAQFIQQQIEIQQQKIMQLDEIALQVEADFGLKGNTLIDCLIAVRSLCKGAKEGAQIYAPLTVMLKGIKSMVESDVQLLTMDDVNVFLAGNRLLNEVGFLHAYSVATREMIVTSPKYNHIASNTSQMLTS